jgi:hypothetical protein
MQFKFFLTFIFEISNYLWRLFGIGTINLNDVRVRRPLTENAIIIIAAINYDEWPRTVAIVEGKCAIKYVYVQCKTKLEQRMVLTWVSF